MNRRAYISAVEPLRERRTARPMQLIVTSLLLAALSACGGPAGTPAPTTTPVPTVDPAQAAGPRAAERVAMVEDAVLGFGIDDPAVVEAMLTVPRHRFVPEDQSDQAYDNHPLPIGYGQTISQPTIVAQMTEAVALEPDDVVLEVGTGSGYQAAVLSQIVEHVYTVEIIGELVERASGTLDALGYGNVTVEHADGYLGWQEHAPFDAIVVTAAPDHVPPPLRAQLADGGTMIIPVGPVGGFQELWLIERDGDAYTTTSLGDVAFVPLTRDVREE